MELRNKKTGQIGVTTSPEFRVDIWDKKENKWTGTKYYATLKELNDEWEDIPGSRDALTKEQKAAIKAWLQVNDFEATSVDLTLYDSKNWALDFVHVGHDGKTLRHELEFFGREPVLEGGSYTLADLGLEEEDEGSEE